MVLSGYVTGYGCIVYYYLEWTFLRFLHTAHGTYYYKFQGNKTSYKNNIKQINVLLIQFHRFKIRTKHVDKNYYFHVK